MRLVERDHPIQQLRDGFEISRASGQGCTAIVDGRSGTGKTALLNVFAELTAREGALVLTAFGSATHNTVPASVLSQLLDNDVLDDEGNGQLTGLLDELASAGFAGGSDLFGARILQRVCGGLLQVAKERPVVICVDDAHLTDTVSLQFLQHLVRRIDRVPIVLVLTEPTDRSASDPDVHDAELHDELARQPRFQRITMGALSADGTRSLFEQTMPPAAADRLAAEATGVTGGNPQLLTALSLDMRAADERTKAVVPGGQFQRALRSCLHSSGRLAVEVARAIAVLGDAATPVLVARLAETDLHSVEAAAEALSEAGLLHGMRFRHPSARDAVLDGFARDDRTGAHQRAADLLFETGASAVDVAGHLVAAGSADGVLASSVLAEAAEQAMLDGDVEQAKAFLYLIDATSTDPQEQARTATTLSLIEWRLNPLAAVRRLPRLGEAVVAGHLRDHTAVAVFENLLWYRDGTEAEAALATLCTDFNDDDMRARSALLGARSLLQSSFPSFLTRVDAVLPPWSADRAQPRISLDASSGLIAAFGCFPWLGAREDAVAEAERMLRDTSMTEADLGPVINAVTALTFADRLGPAAAWLEQLAGSLRREQSPVWQALLRALFAEVAMRRGDPRSAEHCARDALRIMPAEGWGVGVAVPMSTLLFATIAQGKHAETAQLLDQPVPHSLYDSVFGLLYLLARGYNHIAGGRFGSALEEFTACGDLMQRWDVEYPATVPWRTGAAHAWLRLGDLAKANQLASAQIDVLDEAPTRARGVALRLLAATSKLSRRRQLLAEAVAVLDQVGDRLELSRAMRDLGHALALTGEPNRAEAMRRQASELARQRPDRVASPFRALSVPTPHQRLSVPGRARRGTDEGMITLTDAERRVSAMAARGSSNREIASALSITVSTVEQHLTKAYKKLRVTRRRDLPRQLLTD